MDRLDPMKEFLDGVSTGGGLEDFMSQILGKPKRIQYLIFSGCAIKFTDSVQSCDRGTECPDYKVCLKRVFKEGWSGWTARKI